MGRDRIQNGGHELVELHRREARRFGHWVGVNGQMCVMNRETNTVIALNGAYPMAETPRFASMQFHQFVPAILDAVAD